MPTRYGLTPTILPAQIAVVAPAFPMEHPFETRTNEETLVPSTAATDGRRKRRANNEQGMRDRLGRKIYLIVADTACDALGVGASS